MPMGDWGSVVSPLAPLAEIGNVVLGNVVFDIRSDGENKDF